MCLFTLEHNKIHKKNHLSLTGIFEYRSQLIFVLLIFVFNTIIMPSSAETDWHKNLIQGDNDLERQALPQAEKSFRQALSAVLQSPRKTDDELKCLAKLANVLALENKTRESANIYQNCINLTEKAYGKNSPKILPYLFALGSICESEGNHNLAMQYYTKALSINEKKYGPYSPAFATSSSHLHMPLLDESSLGQSSLFQQSDLSTSQDLENNLPSYKRNLLQTDDNSDQDLISSYEREINNEVEKNHTSGKVAVSSDSGKQSASAKHANGI